MMMLMVLAANSPENPRKGTMINKPGGANVYEGVPKDYTGNTVTAANFLKVMIMIMIMMMMIMVKVMILLLLLLMTNLVVQVLAGESMVGIGSGKTLQSGPDDHVFVFYSDHGATGLVAMPVGE
jgi:legumain